MFKDKQLHGAVAVLIERFTEFLTANNTSIAVTNNNFQTLHEQIVAVQNFARITDSQQQTIEGLRMDKLMLEDKLASKSADLDNAEAAFTKVRDMLKFTEDQLYTANVELNHCKFKLDESQTELQTVKVQWLKLLDDFGNVSKQLEYWQGLSAQRAKAPEVIPTPAYASQAVDMAQLSQQLNQYWQSQGLQPPAPAPVPVVDTRDYFASSTPVANKLEVPEVQFTQSANQTREWQATPGQDTPDEVMQDNLALVDLNALDPDSVLARRLTVPAAPQPLPYGALVVGKE